ncbi:MAG: YDG domain-containing protein [Pseudomonadota bacterium]|nr:YDG domain-containing protein [Pseudomonadota bacterium]
MHRHASLNRIFRLVWSHVHQAWVAVSETSRGRGKGTNRKLLLAAAALAASQMAQAGPTGGQVTNGSGTVNQAGTTTTIIQSSQNLSLQWNSFNTTAAETVNFVQPSSAAIAVNRIVDTNATQFFGKLNANGQVYVINPNGVVFGAGSQVNVGGLVASTLDIDDAARAGAARRFSGNGTGTVVNQGTITTGDGGYVAFLGKQVSNQGTIIAPKGSVALGAGSDVTLSFAGNSLVGMQVNQSTLDNLAENGGLIRADGGAVILSAGARDAVLASVVNNTGIIEARSAREVNGAIVLDGGLASTVTNSGTLDASGRNAGALGGTVKVLGQEVILAASSRIDVAGDAGGGTALVGGNFVGAGPERNAHNTTVAAGSTLLADAVTAGAGGNVAVWSDGTTQFDGRISARGGAASGNGGSVETSGKTLSIGKDAVVNTLAPHGTTGDWLLDPQDLTIGGYNGINGDITGDQISQALNSSNVTIKTGPTVTCTNAGTCGPGAAGGGDITILDGVWIGGYFDNNGQTVTWTAPTTLTLSAYRDIKLVGYANIAWEGPGTVNLRADNAATGTGTVRFGDYSLIYSNNMGTANIYYNPVNLSTPTDYANMRTVDNQYAVFQDVMLNTYMLINVTANVASKTYDGTTAATLTGVSPRALPTGVALNIGGATTRFLDKNAGVNKATQVSGVTLSGANAAQYAINGLDSNTATIAKANLAVSGIGANNKVYNGTNAATLSGSASVTAFGTDAVSVAGTGTGLFADKNAGAGKAVTVSGYTLAGLDAGNYNLVQPAGLTASISKASLAVSGVSAANKIYDATLAASLSGTAVVTAFGSDVVNVAGTGSATFADKNAGAGKAVTVSGYSLTGFDAGNYNLVQPAGLTATISKANLALSGLAAGDKTYDATTAATLAGTASVAALGSDVVNLSGTGVGTFFNKNAGAGKAVTVSGYSLGGFDAGNYNLVQPAGLTATIAKANLALTGITANGKTYDGTTAATLAGSAAAAALGSDVVNVTGSGTGTFADKNAGAGKAVAVSGYALAGTDAGNYNLVQPGGLTATIAKASLAVSGIIANGKTYDATAAATLAGSATVAGIGSDVVNVAGSGIGTFADKNAGVGKAVTISGYTLSGLDAGNYNLVQPAGLTATINKANLALSGLAASDKTYDATAAATLSGNVGVAALGSDVVNVAGTGVGAFANKNAGVGKAVTVTGYSLSGLDAGNYNLVQPAGLSASIAKASLALTGITANGKTYDGTAAATLAGSAAVAALGNDTVNLTGSGTGTFADKNAGVGKAVTVSGYTLAGTDAGNYNLVQPAGLTATIAKANLAVSGIIANSKTYDATAAATLAGSATVAGIGSDVVNVAGSGTGTFADKNAGAGKAVTVSGYTLSGLDAGNYNLVQPAGLTATINKANLALSGLAASDKTYDATTAATLAGTASVAALGSDVVNVSGTGVGTFFNKNAGVGKAVTVSGYTLGGFDAGNYNLVQPAGLTATIAKANLALAGITANGKTYDGTTAATLAGSAGVAALGNDSVNLTGSGGGTFADKNAGVGKAVTVSGYTLAGTDAGNYNLVQPAGLTATIGKAILAVSGIVANGKTYDATVAATLAGSARVTAIGSDVVNVAGSGTGTFADKNAGVGKAVTVSGYTLSGLDAGNYNLVQPAGLSATIDKATLAIGGLTAQNKVYDSTTAVTLAGTASVAALGSDVVNVGGGSAAFADKNAGTGKTVVASGYTLSGLDAGNYIIAQPTGLAATISRANLSVSGLAATNKTYDATTSASLAGTAAVAAIGSDVVNLSGTGSGAFADKNAGSGKAIVVSGYTLSGLDAGNYNLVAPASLTADIARASLAVSGVIANDKTYDGAAAATLGGAAAVAALGSDVVSVTGTGSGVFADKNAGVGKTVTATGFSLSGVDAGNYNVVQPAGLTANIGKATLAVNGLTAQDKVYDSTTAATLSGTARVAGFGSDVVDVSGGNAAFADKNAGTGKAVVASGFTLSGGDAGNYTLVQPAGLNATIGRADLVVAGVTANGRTYDATTTATLSGTAAVTAIGSDVVSVTGSGAGVFADKNAGNGKAVTVTGLTLSGLDAGNYNLVAPAGLTADIARASLAVSGVTANDKTYDGTVGATLAGSAAVAALGADVVSVLNSGSGAFADKNAGSGKSVTVSGFALGGVDAANYSIVQPTGLTATIGKASLAVLGVTANSKAYDGTTAATLAGNASVAAFGNDAVSVTGSGTGVFADKNAGTGKLVTVGGFALSGVDAGNYTVLQPTGVRADIGKAQLAVSGITASDKLFDGTTTAKVSATGAVLAGRIGTDNVTLSSTGAFADAAAGTGKTVNLSNVYGGADLANYTVVDQATALASITSLPVPPVSPVTPVAPVTPVTSVTPAAVKDAVVQVQSIILAPQQNDKPRDEAKDKAGNILIKTRFGAGPNAPTLQILNGGVQLPPLAINSAE